MPMVDLPQRLDELDSLEKTLRNYLAKPSFWLLFPAEIEQRFEAVGDKRIQRFRKGLLMMACVLVMATLLEWFLIPDSRELILSMRAQSLFLVGLAELLLRTGYGKQKREWIVTGLMIFITFISARIVSLGVGVESAYHLSLILILLFTNQYMRVRLRFAAVFSLIWFVSYACVLILRTQSHQDYLLELGITLGVLSLSISAKRAMELDNRATFSLKLLNAIYVRSLELSNQRLSELARFDGLTELANRREFDEYLFSAFRVAQSTATPLSVIFADVDWFKKYNDMLGHQVGDDCLCLVASIVRYCARKPDALAARYGGEEFIILLPDTDLEQARAVAEELRGTVQNLGIRHPGSPFECVTVSVGVASGVPGLSDRGSDFVKNADDALYLAKSSGRNQVKSVMAGEFS